MSASPDLRWQPFREPLRATLLRTGLIALIVASAIACLPGVPWRWPLLTLLVLWMSLGGHFVELFFLNGLRPRIPSGRAGQVLARLATWFLGGALLTLGMRLTAAAIEDSTPRWPSWWIGGLAFIGIELVVHLVPLLRRVPNFYDGRG